MVYENKKQNIESDIKFANWNMGYDDLFKQIIEIREMGNQLLFDIKNDNLVLNHYYAKISGLFLTHGHYVINDVEIRKQLKKIEEEIFSTNYLKKVKDHRVDLNKHKMIVRDLRDYFQQICESFSKNGLTMKVIARKQKASDNSTLTPEEKRELEALEEVGIM